MLIYICSEKANKLIRTHDTCQRLKELTMTHIPGTYESTCRLTCNTQGRLMRVGQKKYESGDEYT